MGARLAWAVADLDRGHAEVDGRRDDTMIVRTVCVVGLGYIGLPTAVVLAQAGHRVIGVDVSDHRINLINQGALPFHEQGLETALEEVVATGALVAQRDVPAADVYIIAVPTPFAAGHRADLSYIEAAGRAIAPLLSHDGLVILESTSPPGTTRHLADVILAERSDLTLDGAEGAPVVHFAHAPERVLPGRILVELVENDRVIGGLTARAGILARDLYSSFCRGDLLLTEAETAEMVKLTENAFRDVNIAFANELSIICAELGIDVWKLIDLANHHPRVQILRPGPGVGGHCIAVDPWFIISAAPQASRLLRAARDVNDAKPGFVAQEVRRAMAQVERPVVAALGLAYKADVDDLRESPAVAVVAELARGLPRAQILAIEPHVSSLPEELAGLESVELASLADGLPQANIVVLLVNHSEFGGISLRDLEGKHVVDSCGAWHASSSTG